MLFSIISDMCTISGEIGLYRVMVALHYLVVKVTTRGNCPIFNRRRVTTSVIVHDRAQNKRNSDGALIKLVKDSNWGLCSQVAEGHHLKLQHRVEYYC